MQAVRTTAQPVKLRACHGEGIRFVQQVVAKGEDLIGADHHLAGPRWQRQGLGLGKAAGDIDRPATLPPSKTVTR